MYVFARARDSYEMHHKPSLEDEWTERIFLKFNAARQTKVVFNKNKKTITKGKFQIEPGSLRAKQTPSGVETKTKTKSDI